jgi:RNA polymerase sigma-70 factor (ECF subfamily)
MDSISKDDAFAKLFLRDQRRIYAYIATLLPDRDDAEEIFQQTSLLVWQKRNEFEQDRDFVRWACGIAHNLVRNLRRRSDRLNVNLTDEVLELLSHDRLAAEPNADDRLTALRHCLKSLPKRQAKLIERCYTGTKSVRQVAEQLSIAPAAMYMQLHRIRKALLECIERRLITEKSQ